MTFPKSFAHQPAVYRYSHLGQLFSDLLLAKKHNPRMLVLNDSGWQICRVEIEFPLECLSA
jgi:hypothetical protein